MRRLNASKCPLVKCFLSRKVISIFLWHFFSDALNYTLRVSFSGNFRGKKITGVTDNLRSLSNETWRHPSSHRMFFPSAAAYKFILCAELSRAWSIVEETVAWISQDAIADFNPCQLIILLPQRRRLTSRKNAPFEETYFTAIFVEFRGEVIASIKSYDTKYKKPPRPRGRGGMCVAARLLGTGWAFQPSKPFVFFFGHHHHSFAGSVASRNAASSIISINSATLAKGRIFISTFALESM